MTNNIHTVVLTGLLTNLLVTSVAAPGFSSNSSKVGSGDTADFMSSNDVAYQQKEFSMTSTFRLNIPFLKVNRIEKPKKSYKERYNKITSSRYFHFAYDDKSIGEIMKVDA